MKAFRSVYPRASIPFIAVTASALVAFQSAHASVSYGTAGSTYSQNFDSLPNTPANVSLGASPAGWTDDNASPSAGNFSILGWYVYQPTATTEGGFNGHQRMRISTGSSTTGSFYSFGASGGTDRAIGDIGANTLAPDGQTGNDAGNLYIALKLSNDTGQALTSITIGYTGEEWRDGGSGTAETMTFGWSTTATSVSDPSTSFNNVAGLSWTTPINNTGSGATLDGNAAANRVVISPITITGIDWEPGTPLWLRFTDPQLSNKTDSGLAIDDFTFSGDVGVVPEPSTIALLSLGAIGFLISRRR